jgi:4-amino-4-deoxy-L-arabinose transferase-like glycosyltransferase
LRQMPRALLLALLAGLLLRLISGAVFYRVLPEHGYDTRYHNAGFFFYDAFKRDSDAWAIARSDLPLTTGLLDPTKSDQYGGLLALESLVYAGASGSIPRPLLQVGLTAFVSVLAILYTWAYARQEFSESTGNLAGWIVALFPEAVLMATLPMREPYIATAMAMALFGYSAARHGRRPVGIGALVGGIALGLIVSPPFAVLILTALGLALLLEAQVSARVRWGVIGAFLLLAVLAGSLSVRGWQTTAVGRDRSLLTVLTERLSKVPEFQLERLEQGSGWVAAIFERTPDWTHPALAIFYGVTQPLLPAALADNTSIPLMRGVAVWRATGWFLLTVLLVYGMLVAATREGWRQRSVAFLAIVTLLTTIVAAYWGGGDQWDNPRYRSAFLAAQAVFAAWAWYAARERKSPWLFRVAWLMGGVTVCLLTWYVGRYYQTPRLSLFPTLALAAVFVVLSLAVMFLRDAVRARRGP